MTFRKTTRRFEMYADPNVCPACAAPATEDFGARRYCHPCATSFRAFLRGSVVADGVTVRAAEASGVIADEAT